MSDYDYDDYYNNKYYRELCEQYSDECRERGDYDDYGDYSSEDERDWRDYNPYYDENRYDNMSWYDRNDRLDEQFRAEEEAEEARLAAEKREYCHQRKHFCDEMRDCEVCLKLPIISNGHMPVPPEKERISWEEEYVEYCDHCEVEYYDGIGGRRNCHREVTCVDCGDIFCYQRNLRLAYDCSICKFPSFKRCHRCVEKRRDDDCPECVESQERSRISAKAYRKRVARAQRRRCRRRKAKKAKRKALRKGKKLD